MEDVNAGKMQVKSEVVINKEFFLEHTRTFILNKNSSATLDITIGGDDGFEFTIEAKMVQDPSIKEPKIHYESDDETNMITVTFTNWCAPYYNMMTAIGTKKVKIATINDSEVYVDFTLFFTKDVEDTTYIVFNLYSK